MTIESNDRNQHKPDQDEPEIKPPEPNLAGASGAATRAAAEETKKGKEKDTCGSDASADEPEEKTLFGLLPKMQRAQRRELLAYYEENARWNTDFVMMMALSTSLAALGLLNNSPPAVIGAMLVAPLMTPMLGAGFALIQGNVVLFRNCFKAMFYGIGVSLLASLLMGLITPAHDPTPQIAARGNVNLLDLGVAWFSGMAAAYAGARPKLAATLAGVAIAAALVPPLSVVGIAAASGEWVLAGMAGILFLTNLVAIILGSAFVFKLIGVRGRKEEQRQPLWARRMGMLLILATIGLIVPLEQRFQAQINAGHLGPGTYTIPSKARAAVIKRLNTIEGVEFLTAQRDATAPESGAHVFLAAIGTVPSGLEDMVKADVQTVMGKDSPVRVIILQSAAGAPLEAADPEDREPSISARPRA
jgi:uncharacterized hydrophobic protein (TIGR00271 family)